MLYFILTNKWLHTFFVFLFLKDLKMLKYIFTLRIHIPRSHGRTHTQRSEQFKPQTWGSLWATQAPLSSWKVSGTNRITVGSLGSRHEEGVIACVGLMARQDGERSGLLTRWFPWSLCPVPYPEASEHSSSTYSNSQCSTESRAAKASKKSPPMRSRGDLVLG